MNPALVLLLLLAAAPALASHQWGGVDICETRRDIMPPDMAASQLPESDSPGARVLQRYCTQCHYLTGPGRHTREEWPDVLRRMDTLMGISHFYRGLLGRVAMPDDAEKTALREYLDRHALKTLPPPASGTPPVGAERAWRAICGDCHAAPDPRAYPEAAWPALLARMEARRGVMARQPLTGAQKAAVEDYLAAAWGRPTVSGSGHQGATLPLPSAAASTEDPAGRMISLAAFFGLAALGVWRWRRNGFLPPHRGGSTRLGIKAGEGVGVEESDEVAGDPPPPPAPPPSMGRGASSAPPGQFLGGR